MQSSNSDFSAEKLEAIIRVMEIIDQLKSNPIKLSSSDIQDALILISKHGLNLDAQFYAALLQAERILLSLNITNKELLEQVELEKARMQEEIEEQIKKYKEQDEYFKKLFSALENNPTSAEALEAIRFINKISSAEGLSKHLEERISFRKKTKEMAEGLKATDPEKAKEYLDFIEQDKANDKRDITAAVRLRKAKIIYGENLSDKDQIACYNQTILNQEEKFEIDSCLDKIEAVENPLIVINQLFTKTNLIAEKEKPHAKPIAEILSNYKEATRDKATDITKTVIEVEKVKIEAAFDEDLDILDNKAKANDKNLATNSSPLISKENNEQKEEIKSSQINIATSQSLQSATDLPIAPGGFVNREMERRGKDGNDPNLPPKGGSKGGR